MSLLNDGTFNVCLGSELFSGAGETLGVEF